MYRSVNESTELASTELVFQEQGFTQWQELQKRFREKGPDGHYQLGIVADRLEPNEEGYQSIIHIANPYQGVEFDQDGNIAKDDQKAALSVQSFPSYASVEEIQEIRDNVIPMPEACEMLHKLAEARSISNIILIEGDTAIGKTFIIETFTQCLFGPGVSPIDFYCNGQTDVSELHGMWSPKAGDGVSDDRVRKFLSDPKNRVRLSEVEDKDQLAQIAKEIGLSSDAAWEFVRGAIPKCYEAKFDPNLRRVVDSKGGDGFICHIQEIGRAAPKVANAFLELGGTNGRLAKSLQLWRKGGEIIYRGSDAMIVMSNNPSEDNDFQQVNDLDKALRRRLLPVKSTYKGLSKFSLNMACEKYFRYERDNLPDRTPASCLLEIYNYPDQIGNTIAGVVSAFHQAYISKVKASSSRSNNDLVVPSLDQLGRLADYLIHCQVYEPETGVPDIVETLKRGVDLVYLQGLGSEDAREEHSAELVNLLTGDKLVTKHGGKDKTPEEIINEEVKEAWDKERTENGEYSKAFISETRRAKTRRNMAEVNKERSDLAGDQILPENVRKLL